MSGRNREDERHQGLGDKSPAKNAEMAAVVGFAELGACVVAPLPPEHAPPGRAGHGSRHPAPSSGGKVAERMSAWDAQRPVVEVVETG